MVYLNDKPMGRTPILITDVEPGSHKLTVEKKGFYPQTLWLDYEDELLTLTLDLEEITGFIQVTPTPPDAEVLINDKPVNHSGLAMACEECGASLTVLQVEAAKV